MNEVPKGIDSSPKIPSQKELGSLDRTKEVISRLKFDTNGEYPVPNFDKYTGEDLRGNENNRLWAQMRDLAQIAETQMSINLKVKEKDKFGSYAGTPIPEKVFDENNVITPESSLARIEAFRKEISFLVGEAEKSGICIDKFDRQTGEPIPRDSLRALLQARSLQRNRENQEIQEDIDLAFNTLAKLQNRQ